MNVPDLNISNAHMNYRMWRGMYDVDTMMRAFVDCDMAPWEAQMIFPLCVTEDNVVHALNKLNSLGPGFVGILDQFVRLLSFDDVFNNMSHPWYQHFVIDEKLDPRYVTGIQVLQKRIEKEGELLPGSKLKLKEK